MYEWMLFVRSFKYRECICVYINRHISCIIGRTFHVREIVNRKKHTTSNTTCRSDLGLDTADTVCVPEIYDFPILLGWVYLILSPPHFG